MTELQPQRIIIAPAGPSLDQSDFEMCEHKGIGHPDTITDGVCEAATRALSRAYIEQYGKILHHNVDKGLLIAGKSQPHFEGGKFLEKIKIIICGRATKLTNGCRTEEVVAEAARQYLSKNIRCDLKNFEIIPELHEGSPNLQEVFVRGNTVHYSNDTSFGCGYAPYSRLESEVLGLSKTLKSDSFRKTFPAAGDDFKVMGHRIHERFYFTIALAFIDRYIENAKHYFEVKQAVHDHLVGTLAIPATLRINTLDRENAGSESDLYLTVTGLSAEMGDDGQVGRGNRVNGLITPGRPMSLEATAGKNPTNHVGKIYNVAAHLMAQDMVKTVARLESANVCLLSAIGEPVNKPQAVFVQAKTADGDLDASLKTSLNRIVHQWLEDLPRITEMILKEEVVVF